MVDRHEGELTGRDRPRSLGITLLSGFFLFGFVMCLLTVLALSFPGGLLEPMWRLNPEAQRALQTMGAAALVLMSVVGLACLLTAIGVALRREWGRRLAIALLTVNLLGDAIGAVVRRDPRTLIGLPIAGALVLYLMSRRVREEFASPGS